MEIFITAVVLGVVVLAVRYYLEHTKSKVEPEVAPYKVEPPVEVAPVAPPVVEPVAAPVVEAVVQPVVTVSAPAPELKVVTGSAKKTQPKKSTAPRAKRPVVAKPKAPKTPKVPK